MSAQLKTDRKHFYATATNVKPLQIISHKKMTQTPEKAHTHVALLVVMSKMCHGFRS